MNDRVKGLVKAALDRSQYIEPTSAVTIAASDKISPIGQRVAYGLLGGAVGTGTGVLVAGALKKNPVVGAAVGGLLGAGALLGVRRMAVDAGKERAENWMNQIENLPEHQKRYVQRMGTHPAVMATPYQNLFTKLPDFVADNPENLYNQEKHEQHMELLGDSVEAQQTLADLALRDHYQRNYDL